ncbi:MAG: DUF1294 domain-containing protein [Burkholderiales bacterium]|nr:DUF1294 domain-containing protein [Burkholderiales bacterium]
MDFLINPPTIIWYYLVVNTLSLSLYAWDKSCAIFKWRRISERNLHLSAILGGGLGALAGQLLFRHKIRKPSLIFVAMLSLIVHASVISIT